MNGSVVHFRESESNLGVMNEPQMEQNVGRENTPMISSGFNKANLVVKRASDILIALMFMVIIGFWLFPIIALLIKLDSKGPVFFKQKRHGKHNELFFCYKFRSMVVNQEADTKQATKNDARVTRVGRFIRKTSIDELPQLINVFKGDMSIVGPRPHPVSLNEQFSSQIDGFMTRHHSKPGLTGLAQAKGYRGETAEFYQMYARYRMDIFYLKKWNPVLDYKIIWMTFLSLMLHRENAY
ncbi:sugar transferase [Echinicola vietnamensis]|uniref:Glycosyl transferase possibly involved in lipopolysaccharide synthesis n=1 Tax=Echinicola vietnamensis (strain DSM 17526 / LMG 23754 / KMM 6221) TaxID=926556 RepID=L0G3E2_ECHVK|nr:sugar transferase [Echinicola vietnamensis]AGA80017.1 glycosyl transferase possibly involved in lipopolysaccharide synthesis [Echinicola vietnamensis DSM 17526]